MLLNVIVTEILQIFDIKPYITMLFFVLLRKINVFMILRVTFENILSFNEETQVSFVAGKSSTHGAQISRAQKRDDISVLKSGIIYGANASGKSNIIKAIDVLRKIATGKFPKRNIEPFKLIPQSGRNSKIEIEFKAISSYYAYGVEFNIQGLREEWLYEINSRTDKKVFTRLITNDGNVFDFGTIEGNEDTKQFVRFLSQGTSTDRSFLSEYVKRNGQGLESVKQAFNWFSDTLKIIFPGTRYKGISFRAERDKDFQRTFKSLLKVFNTGIVDIRRTLVKKETINLPPQLLDDILSNLKNGNISAITLPADNEMYFLELGADGIPNIYKQKAIHKDIHETDTIFDMREESDGSIRLLDFIPMLIDLQQNSSVYLIDEIDRSMHPMLSQKLLECYFSSLVSDRDSQLIFTTHECNLLDLNLIRADEVWFVEKDKNGASHMTSLAEYKPREDIRKGYLQGRYGAIPFFAPVKNLNWK